MGMSEFIDGNNRVVVSVFGGLGVLSYGRRVGGNLITEELTGPLGSFQDPLLLGQSRLDRKTDGYHIHG